MAFQYAKLGLAALMAAPAVLAAPLPQQATVTKMVMVCVDQNGATLPCPDSAQPAQTSAAVAAPSSSAAPTSSAAQVVQAAAVKPSSHQTSAAAAPTSAKAASSSAQASAAPSSSAASNPSGGSSTGGKAGLVYTKIDVAQATQIASSSGGKITWMYDWEGTTDASKGQSGYTLGGVEYVPMLHDPSLAPQWEGTVQYAPGPQGTNAQHALFYNEPDNNGISYSSAASDYQSIFSKHVGSNTKLGGPAVMQGSTDYLSNFNKACSGCKIDFNVMHYYGNDASIDSLSSAISAMYKAGGNKPLWVTEFGLKAVRDGGSFSEQQRADFIAAAAKWMDGSDMVERYAPYMVGSSGDDNMSVGGAIAKAYVAA